FIGTLEGRMRVDIGDWIIKGVKGELYPCKPDIFDATYEDATCALRSAQAEDDASWASKDLAKMVLSDCGVSYDFTELLNRVAGRIDRHVERLLTAQRKDAVVQAAPAAV